MTPSPETLKRLVVLYETILDRSPVEMVLSDAGILAERKARTRRIVDLRNERATLRSAERTSQIGSDQSVGGLEPISKIFHRLARYPSHRATLRFMGTSRPRLARSASHKPSWIRFLRWVLTVALLCSAELTHAQIGVPTPAPKPTEQNQPDKSSILPSTETEAQGTCRTPRQAWLQLLYWLSDKNDPKRAAACFDKSAFNNPEEDAPRRATVLKRVLDAKPTWVAIDDIPIDHNYRNANGLHLYEDPSVKADYPGITLIKKNGQWLFSPQALNRATELYPALTGWFERVLPDWIQHQFLGVDAWKYLAVLALIFLALIMQRIVVLIVGTYIRRIVGNQRKYLDDALARADRPIGGLVMAGVFYLGLPILLLPPRVSLLTRIAIEALAAYSLVWLAYRLIDVVTGFLAKKAETTESKLDDQLVPLVSKTLKVFVSVIGGIFVLQNLNVNVGSLLAGLGLGGLAFALAAKDTVANFFGSVMIFIDKPFQIGDWIVLQSTEGVVEEVGFRTTRVRTFYNSLITVPNSVIVGNMVDNYGARRYRRYTTTLGLTYDTPPSKVQAFCEGVRAIIAGMPGMRKDYYLVEFKDFGASALNILLYCFMISPSWNEELRTRTNLNLEIMRLAEALGVAFAFPTQSLHIETMAKPHDLPMAPETQPEDLGQIVDGFGPNGDRALPTPAPLSKGYDC